MTDKTRAHAVIISGGYMPEANYQRYWGDTAFLYKTLREVYGYSASNIFVHMSDGQNLGADKNDGLATAPILVDSPADLDGDGINEAVFPATKAALTTTFSALAAKLTQHDQLLIAVTDHGGVRDMANQNYARFTLGDDKMNALMKAAGIKPMATMLPANSVQNWLIYLWLSSITDGEFRTALAGIKCPTMFLMEQCFSGGFVQPMTMEPNRVIATSCAADDTSLAGASYPKNDWWLMQITEYLRDHVGCSFKEAADYAKANNCPGDVAQYGESTAGLGDLLSLYPATRITLKAGMWNQVSLPVEPDDPSPRAVFSPALLACYEWDAAAGRYVNAPHIIAGRGYVVAVKADISLAIRGTLRPTTAVPLVKGWNLVGPRDDVVAPAGTLEWTGERYLPVLQCQSGGAYWIAASAAQTIW